MLNERAVIYCVCYGEHAHTMKANKQNSKYAQNDLGTDHTQTKH